MTYYSITNADGKLWILPSHNMRTAMLLYQPSSWKGIILKKFLPLLHIFTSVRTLLRIKDVPCPVIPLLRTKLEDIFGETNLEYAYFGGTPCAHQKSTVQVFKGNHILGYCKISRNSEINTLFQHETLVLDDLNRKGVSNIPQCLYSGELLSGVFLFVQTTMKTTKSKVRHNIGKQELLFLSQMHGKTAVSLSFDQTDENAWLVRLEHILDRFTEDQRDVIRKGISEVRRYYSLKTEWEFSAYHSDFTPWNSFTENGELFVFDFEYAGLTYIPYLDLLHYYTQTGIFERGETAETLFGRFVQESDTWSRYFDEPAISYIAYLLDQLAKFGYREKGTFPESLEENISIWCTIIKMLVNESSFSVKKDSLYGTWR